MAGGPLLHRLQHERHTRLFEEPYGFRPMPPGFRAEEFIGLPHLDGFLPVAEAAERMGVSEEEIMDMARRFLLTYRVVGRTVYVRPAIIED